MGLKKRKEVGDVKMGRRENGGWGGQDWKEWEWV